MKNREKYGDEILTAIKSGASCDFMKETVIPLYIDSREDSDEFCVRNNCIGCTNLFAFWLDGEYNKPPTEWMKVPVDTLVRVRERENQEWILRYFKGINEDSLRRRYEAWESGATSKTAKGKYLCWNYCELVENEDEE